MNTEENKEILELISLPSDLKEPFVIDFDDRKSYQNYENYANGIIWISELLGKGEWTKIRIGFDTKNFISLGKLKFSIKVEHHEWYQQIIDHFAKIVKLNQDLLEGSISSEVYGTESDALFKALKEPKGLFFGYSKTYGDGIGMGKQAFEDIENSIKNWIKILPKTNHNDIPNLILLFGDGIGPDKTSDFIAGIIYDHLIDFTKKSLKNSPKNCEEMRVYKKGHKPEEIRIVLVPSEITDQEGPGSPFSTDNEFKESIKSYRDPLSMLTEDIYKKVIIDEKNLGKSDAIKALKNGNPDLIKLFLENQDRQDQRKFLNNTIAIKQISKDTIQELGINLENFTINKIYKHLVKKYYWLSAIHQQLTNKIFCQIAVIITDSTCYIEHFKNLEEMKKKFDEFETIHKVVLIIEETTKQKTIEKKIQEIKTLLSDVKIEIIKK